MTIGTNLKEFGTKAETLIMLSKLGFNVPEVLHFTVDDWKKNSADLIDRITSTFSNEKALAIRSSSKAEDTLKESMAGAFDSFLNISTNDKNAIRKTIDDVIASYDDNIENQVLIQTMIHNVAFSGVVMTKVLDDGSPYYVINFDDSTGKTDTVTSGSSINKTVYIYNGFSDEDFDSPYLRQVLKLVLELEEVFEETPLDIEFAVDFEEVAHLLQVRPITTSEHWRKEIHDLVSERIKFLAKFVDRLMHPRNNIFGDKTLLGIMPDWNPAEMIGEVPGPLAMSLYRELITRKSWRLAREKMGYRKMPNVELMVSLFGRVYIDVRNSFNSLLPAGLDNEVAEKLVNAYIHRLEEHPHLHDKVEFEIVPTVYDFSMKANFKKRYPGLLNKKEYTQLSSALKKLTKKALKDGEKNTLNNAFRDIEHLKKLQNNEERIQFENPFEISDRIQSLIDECINFGTIPFSIIARHGFIAESLLRSAIEVGVMTKARVDEFKQSISTVSGDFSRDFYKASTGKMKKEKFLVKYGHLRPSSYDILSPCYKNRKDIFEGKPKEHKEDHEDFKLTKEEHYKLKKLLKEHGFKKVSPERFFSYARKAIVGREYAKFIFTKHLSQVIEHIAEWGKFIGFDRADMSMLTLDEIQSVLFAPLTNDVKSFFVTLIERAKENYALGSSFKLSYLIRSIRDIYIVPIQRSAPNFVGNKRIEGKVVVLNPHTVDIPDLTGKIVCIEGADPGYDWIFSREIAALVTKYGGANSHMAIRCAEYGLPAAIGCGEQPFERISKAGQCLLDCQGKRLEPIVY